MKHRPLVLALALTIAAAPLVYGQTPDKKPSDPGVEKTLMKIEQDALTALLKRDVATFGKMFAEDAVITTPDGGVGTKAALLADVKSGALALESSTISEMKVWVHGDTAVVNYITTDKGKYKGQDISGRFRWTDTFVRRAGTWVLIAGHGSPIQPPPK